MKKIIHLTLATLATTAAILPGIGCSHWGRTVQQRCNPLSQSESGRPKSEDCFLPFPSSFYSRPDPTSVTGIRVDLTDAALPISSLGAQLDPTPYNRRDGFSNVATLLAHFPTTKIDDSSLPSPNQTRRSLEKSSSVQLLEFATGLRTPLFAELDANADPKHGDKQALIIQPVERLRPKTRYIVVIQGLRSKLGQAIEPLSGFRKLRDSQTDPRSSLAAESAKFEEIFGALARYGVPRAGLQLAWDFTTGSDEAVTHRLLSMRDAARASGRQLASEKTNPITVHQAEKNPPSQPGVFKRIQATFQVTSFLEEGNGNRLHLDVKGEPVAGPRHSFPLTIHVPDCARNAKGPLAVMIYGHGTFNSADAEMSNEYSREIINRLCVIQVGTDWLGRSKKDLAYFLTKIIPNWNNFPQITDRLQQAHVNMLTLGHLIRSGALESLPELQINGRSIVDSNRLYYYGISEGACQGVTTLALSGDIQRGALNVPCGFWSMFFWRSSDFYLWRWALRLTYPGRLERQKLLVLSQLLWDYTDPANYGAHLIKDLLPGSASKKILYQEGINDASVPNLTTRAMVRTIGLKLLNPSIESVEGVDQVTGPQDSAYTQFDVGIRPRLGGNNVPPAKNTVHEDIRRLESAKEQLTRFLREDGKVEQTCAGRPCAYPL